MSPKRLDIPTEHLSFLPIDQCLFFPARAWELPGGRDCVSSLCPKLYLALSKGSYNYC